MNEKKNREVYVKLHGFLMCHVEFCGILKLILYGGRE